MRYTCIIIGLLVLSAHTQMAHAQCTGIIRADDGDAQTKPSSLWRVRTAPLLRAGSFLQANEEKASHVGLAGTLAVRTQLLYDEWLGAQADLLYGGRTLSTGEEGDFARMQVNATINYWFVPRKWLVCIRSGLGLEGAPIQSGMIETTSAMGYAGAGVTRYYNRLLFVSGTLDRGVLFGRDVEFTLSIGLML